MPKNKFSKILMLFLALFMVFSTTTPIHAENNAKNMVISDHLIDYSSKRLIVSIDKDKITNPDLIIGEYHLDGDAHPTFLIQYETEKEAKEEYIKYKEIADFVDVDFIISSAEGEASNDTELTEDNNAFTELNNLTENLSVEPQTVNGEKVLALIDTGVGTSDSYDTAHVIERSTVLSSSSNTVGWDDNGHGEAMRVNMVAVNPDVRILSVKVLDGKGNGRLSDVYAGIVYAVEYNADVISLSLAAKSTASNTNIQTLQNAINRAHEKGIHVYAAAGNYNAPAENYFPCANEHVVCIGSANEDGTKRSSSNYGDPVAFNTIAGSTSAATAKTASVVLARGPEYPFENLNSGLFYDRDFTLENPFTSPDVQIYFDSNNPTALDMAEAVDFNIDFNENDVIITGRIDTSKIKNYSPDKKYLLGDIISIEGDYESYGITSSGENYTVYTIKNVASDLELLLDCQAIAKEMVVCSDGSSANSEAECPVVKYDVMIEGGEAQLSQAEPGVVVGIYPFEHTGRTFIRWEVIEGDVEFEDNTQPHTSFVMPNSNVKIKAVFQDTTPTACPASNYTPELVDVIIVNPNTGGLNTILDEITIKPVKKEGYTFTEFEVEYESVLPTSSIFMGDIEKEETKISLNCIKLTKITAHYEKDDTPIEEQKYKLILVTDTEESKPVEAKPGSKIKITAAPAPEGMEFTGWEIIEGDAIIEDSYAQETYVTMVESDVKIKANYKNVQTPIDDPTEEMHKIKLTNAYILPEMIQELEFSSLELDREIEIYAPRYIETTDYVSSQDVMEFEKFEVIKGDITLSSPEEMNTGFKAKFTMPYEEVEIMAVYKQSGDIPPVVNNKYKVTAVNGVASETEVAPGTEVTVTFIPPCTDCSYEFHGWESEDIEIENPTATTITFIMPKQDVKIVGDVSLMIPPALIYTVNLEVIDGTIEGIESNKIESYVYIEGDNEEVPTFVIKANEPSATGCSFTWEVLEGDKNLIKDLSSPTTEVELRENMIVRAMYECIGEPPIERYELTLISDHFDTKITEIEEGEELTVSAPDVENYKFVKWEVLEGEVAEDNLTKQEFKFTPEVISNFKLKAIYEKVINDNPGTEPGDNQGDTPGTNPGSNPGTTPTPTPTTPTSDNSKGACAAHGGVDCSRKDADGSVYCMDGTKDSTVKYDNVAKCKTNTVTSGNSNVTAQTTAVNTGLDSSLRLYITLGALSIITLIGLLVRKNIRKSEI